MNRGFTLVFAASLFGASTVWADVEAAKNYVKEAEELISGNDLEGAGRKLELAETELDGEAAAAKAPVMAQIEAARTKMASVSMAADKPKYKRMLDRAMDDAESGVGNLANWPTAEREMEELLADPKAKAVLGPELDAAAKKYATFKKLNAKKSSAQFAEYANDALKNLQDKWTESKATLSNADSSPNSKESAIEDTQRAIESAREAIAKLPADDDRAKDLTAKVDQFAAEFTTVALAGKTKDYLEQLQRQFETYKGDWTGWEKEGAGPTWAEYQAVSGDEKISSFNAPKTKVFIARIGSMLEDLDKSEDYKMMQNAPEVKAAVDNIRKQAKEAYKQMLDRVTPVVDAAVKSSMKDQNPYDRLNDDVRLALGEESPDTAALQAKIKKVIDAHVAQTTGAEDAKNQMITMLRAKAEESWPSLKEGIDATGDADLSNAGALVGKNISFTSDNLMGYRFKPGDYYFATTIGGVPVAGKFDPALMKQIKAVEEKMGRSIGDDDGDGKWEIIATVSNRHTKLLAKRQAESNANVDGTDVKVTTDYAEPVDAVVIDIIAAKCGPFAGSKDKGVLKEDGTIGK